MNTIYLLIYSDKLYILDKNLNIAAGGTYTWNTNDTLRTCTPAVSAPKLVDMSVCLPIVPSSPFQCTQNDPYLCRNHIRIYQRPSPDSNTLFVCGTQSSIEPQCRILNVSMCNTSVVHLYIVSSIKLEETGDDLYYGQYM